MTLIPTLIPESAPFNEEQRAWLNGFLAGWIGLQEGASASWTGPAQGTSEITLSAPSPAAAEPEEFPWHDPALPLEERLKLSADKPLPRRLMAAMAQLNCGSCGYDCQRYAEAISSGAEKCLTLCSPGGKPTSKVLKDLVRLELGSPSAPLTATPAPATPGQSPWSRSHPFPARIHSIRNLNQAGSSKQTSHVEIDLSGSELTYEVGDALGVYPTNCPELVEQVLAAIDTSTDSTFELDGKAVPVAEAIRHHFCLREISDELITTLADRCPDAEQSEAVRRLLDDAEAIDGHDVLDLLQQFPSIRLTSDELLGALPRMKPRLYSISSSQKAHPGQVHLTVGRVAWNFRDRQRKGVASTMFSDRLGNADPVRVFVHQAHGFSVPKNPESPMIMIGPGTGIAPFRAFLQERQVTGANGRNWLFFGDQQAATDFLYEDELQTLLEQRVLTRLDVAFSRDQENKIYVQDRMLEQGAEFWSWLQQGAHVYVCGDARRMAVDVDKALRKVIAQFGRLSEQQADVFVAEMIKQKRYCRDVY